MPTQLMILAQSGLHAEAWNALLARQPEVAVRLATPDVAAIGREVLAPGPTALLIDLPLPAPSLPTRLSALAPGAGQVFLVPDYDLKTILPLLQAGAAGFVAYTEPVADLARAIIAVGRGELFLPRSIAGSALAALAQGGDPGAGPVLGLSERESEVLRLLAVGLTNKDIAQSLILSVRTIEAHLRSIFSKLGVRSRTEAVLWAVRHGYGTERHGGLAQRSFK